MPQALGPYGILAVLALVTADLFFIASTHYGHDHVIMSAYWVRVGLLSTVYLWVYHRLHWFTYLVRHLPLFMFVLSWAFLSALWSRDPLHTSWRALALFLEVVLGIFMAFALAPKRLMAVLCWAFAGLLIVNVACVLIFPAEGIQLVTRAGLEIWKGTTVNRNQLGALAAGACVFFLVGTLHRRLHWLPGIAFAVLAAFVVYMTRSATSLILLITFVPLTLLLFVARRLRKTYVTAAALAALAAYGIWSVDLYEVTDLVQRDTTLSQRTAIWEEAVDLMRHRPLTGYGFNMVWGHGSASWFPDLPETVRVFHAHNGYVQLAAELGLPAAVIASLFLARMTAASFSAYARTGSAFAMFCFLYFAMFAVGNLTESKLFFLLWPEWSIFVALAVAFVRSRHAPSVARSLGAARRPRRLDAAMVRPVTAAPLALRPGRR
jgi:exopolysaccharide production protein ExoQ